MAHFIIKAGHDEGSLIPIVGDETSIGRSLSSQIVLSDGAASRSHALVLKRGDNYFLRDLGSTHGTCVNGVRLTEEHVLRNQDLVKIGATALLFLASDAQAEIEASASPVDNTSPVQTLESQTVLLVGGQTVVYSLLARPEICESAQAGPLPPALTRVISATDSLLDRKQFLDALMQQVFEVFTPDRGALLLREKADGPCLPFITRPAHKEWSAPPRLLDYVVEKRTAVLVDNAGEGIAPPETAWGSPESAPSALCVPLAHRDAVLGVLYLDSCSGDVVYQKEDLALLCRVATYAAASLQKIQLLQGKIEFERHALAREVLGDSAKDLAETASKMGDSCDDLDAALRSRDLDRAGAIARDIRASAVHLSELARVLTGK
jgi:pSer/pThr/pTyr-binding forkhead associated (FHA) protein